MQRFGFGTAGVIAALAAAALAVPALGQPIPRFTPLTTNVPSLAWRGEELRLVKCVTRETDGAGATTLMAAGRDAYEVDWLVEDWSGAPFNPPLLEVSTIASFTGNNEYDGAPCVKADFVSLKAGLAQIKLVVSDRRTGNPVLKHQFLAGWLSLATPTIRELASTSVPGGGGVLGDPAGDGVLLAGGAPGRVQVQVRGILPLGNTFTELGLPAQITLPTEADGVTSYWDDLARAMATTSDARPIYRDAPWRTWDIHDDRLRTEGHVASVLCGLPLASVDAVDACLGAELLFGDGRYSRAFGDLSRSPTFGPFDPLRPDETLLPDGKLDDGDVPMPSAIVEVAIAPNRGGPTDTGGVGSLGIRLDGEDVGVYKCIPYTRDTRCTSADGPHPPTVPDVAPPPFGPAGHNHYAPYYSRWLPATSATVGSSLEDDAPRAREASGTDGPGSGNNFPGYRGEGLYDYWNLLVLDNAEARATRCLDRGGRYRQTPAGPQRVHVFSDEHGEAQVYFNPGRGFFFDRLGVGPNANGGCDLRDVTDLGFADIQAIARYPYQKVTDPDKASNVLRKVVRHRFRKDVDCRPKGPIPPLENGFAFICTATAIDIDGAPIAGEVVCFAAGGPGTEAIAAYPIGTPSQRDGSFVCLPTDRNGQASVEVFGKCGDGNVIAFFREEGLIRVDRFTYTCVTPPTTTATTPTTTGTTPTTTAPTTTTGTTPTTTATPTPTPTPGATTGTQPGTTATTTTTARPGTTTTTQRPTTSVRGTTTVRRTDVCPNIKGPQAKVPKGKVKKGGKCVTVKKKQAVKAAKKAKRRGCVLNGRFVFPCVRGKG